MTRHIALLIVGSCFVASIATGTTFVVPSDRTLVVGVDTIVAGRVVTFTF